MKLIPLSQCENTLKLPRKSVWQKPLPQLAVKGVLVTPDLSVSGRETVVIELGENLATVLHALYPGASWYELLGILDSKFFDEAQTTHLLQLYGYRWSDDLKKLSRLRFSETHEAWLSEKSLSPREVAPLLMIPRDLQQTLLEKISNSKATRSQAARIVELASEIAAMANVPADFGTHFLMNADPDTWIKQLETVRFPETSQRDSDRAARLQKLDLPLKVKAEYKRQGDETGVELRISAKGPGDLKKILSDLNSKPWEDAWNSH